MKISTPNIDYVLSPELRASDLATFLRDRTLSAAESMETRLASILEDGERLEHWARCSGGTESVKEIRYGGMGASGGYDRTEAHRLPVLAVATDRRILFLELPDESMVASLPHRTICGGGELG